MSDVKISVFFSEKENSFFCGSFFLLFIWVARSCSTKVRIRSKDVISCLRHITDRPISNIVRLSRQAFYFFNFPLESHLGFTGMKKFMVRRRKRSKIIRNPKTFYGFRSFGFRESWKNSRSAGWTDAIVALK